VKSIRCYTRAGITVDARARIIVIKAATEPECFIVTPDEVRHFAHRGEKDDRVSYWLQPNKYDTNEFREAWHRIGRGDIVPPSAI